MMLKEVKREGSILVDRFTTPNQMTPVLQQRPVLQSVEGMIWGKELRHKFIMT